MTQPGPAAPPATSERSAGPAPVVLDRRYWLLALVPLGVLLLMYLVLDATRRDDVTFAIIAAEQFPGVAASEARHRSFWVAAFLLSAAASAAVALSTALGLWRLPVARDRTAIITVILAVIALVIFLETIGPRGEVRWYDSMGRAVVATPAAEEESTDAAPAPNRHLYRALFASPPEDGGMTPVLHLLDHGLDAIKILGTVALTLTGAGLVLTLARPQRPLTLDREAAQLADALARQQALLQQATTVYVLALVAMLAWMHWPLPYLADDQVRDAYRELLLGNALVQGVGYSLGLAALYLPPALLLHRRIADLAAACAATPGPTLGASDDWLKEQGLQTAPFDQLRQLATVLLPTLVSLLPALANLWN